MKRLPLAALAYVIAVIAAGAIVAVTCLPQAKFQEPWLFLALLLMSSATAALKVNLPLTTGGSTLSVGYAVDFASLLLLGPHETMLVAGGGAVSPCHINTKEENPAYRTLFSVSSLLITVQAAGFVFRLLGGTGPTMPFQDLARPLVGAATTYFIVNTGLVAAAIALSTRHRIGV